MKRTPAYTLPNGRQATSREYRERMALHKARRACPECKATAENAYTVHGTYPPLGSLFCPAHRS